MFRISAVLLAGVGVTSALHIDIGRALNLFPSTNLSSTCQSTLMGLLNDPGANSCFNIPGLAAIITLQPNSSAIPPLNTWLQGLCAANPCSNSTINAVVANVTSGCQSDISNANVANNVLQTIIQQVPQSYPTMRSMACLKIASNDTLCATSTFLNFEQFKGGPATIDTVQQLLDDSAPPQLPASVKCTGCTQAALEMLLQDPVLSAANPTVQSTVASQCGSGFLSGTQAPGIVAGTGSAAPTGAVAALFPRTFNGASAPGATLTFETASFITFILVELLFHAY